MVHTHSPMLNSEGAFSIVPSPSGYSLQTHGFARFWTNTQMVQIPSNTNIILDFDYKVLDNPKKEEQLGWFKYTLQASLIFNVRQLPSQGISTRGPL
jgi:hypothetical protein